MTPTKVRSNHKQPQERHYQYKIGSPSPIIASSTSIKMASSDSSSSSSSESSPSGREIRRELVWLKEKVKSTPRGHFWDLMNREGRVQEVCFTTGMTKKQTREAIVTTFPRLSGFKDKRYGFHSFAGFT